MRNRTLISLATLSLAVDTLLVVAFGGTLWLPGGALLVAIAWQVSTKRKALKQQLVLMVFLLMHALLVRHPVGALVVGVQFSATVMQMLRFYNLVLWQFMTWFVYFFLLAVAGWRLSASQFVAIVFVHAVWGLLLNGLFRLLPSGRNRKSLDNL